MICLHVLPLSCLTRNSILHLTHALHIKRMKYPNSLNYLRVLPGSIQTLDQCMRGLLVSVSYPIVGLFSNTVAILYQICLVLHMSHFVRSDPEKWMTLNQFAHTQQSRV